MTELAAERVAHAATREELRRAREALRDALLWCETLAGECISVGLDDDDEIKRLIGDVRAKRDALSSAPASPSTEARIEYTASRAGACDCERRDGVTTIERVPYHVAATCWRRIVGTRAPSTEEAVRAGFEAAQAYAGGDGYVIPDDALDPAAIAARLEGR